MLVSVAVAAEMSGDPWRPEIAPSLQSPRNTRPRTARTSEETLATTGVEMFSWDLREDQAEKETVLDILKEECDVLSGRPQKY